jgi:hypothetical protein
MTVNPNAPIAATQFTRVQLQNQIANLPPHYAVPANQYNRASYTQLQTILLNRQMQMIIDRDTEVYGQGNELNRVNGMLDMKAKLYTHFIAAPFRERIIYQIVPAAITLAIASALVNVAIFYSYFNPAPAADGTNETCTKAIKDFEDCKKIIPTLQKRRNEVMAEWKACLDTLQGCQNSTNETLANYNDLLSQLEACKNSTGNKTVN